MSLLQGLTTSYAFILLAGWQPRKGNFLKSHGYRENYPLTIYFIFVLPSTTSTNKMVIKKTTFGHWVVGLWPSMLSLCLFWLKKVSSFIVAISLEVVLQRKWTWSEFQIWSSSHGHTKMVQIQAFWICLTWSFFHNGLQKWTAIALPVKGDPLCN